MNRQLVRLGLITLVLAGVLTFLFVRTQNSPLRNHSDTLDLLREIEHVNAKLNEDLLSLNSQLLQHYDSIETAQQRLTFLVQQLIAGKGRIYGMGDQEIDRKVNMLQSMVVEKGEILERFKTQHAIFQNSLSYFNMISSSSSAGLAQVRQVAALRALESDVLYYVTTGEQKWYEAVRAKLDALGNDTGKEGSAPTAGYLANFLIHARQIVEQRAGMQEMFASAGLTSLANLSGEVQKAYMNYYTRETQAADYYRQIMYLASALLVGLVAYIMLLLSRNAMALFEEKERAHVTLASIRDGVVVTDKQGIVEFINPGAERLTGFSNAEAIGQPLEQVFRLFDELAQQPIENCVRRCLREGHPAGLELPALLKAKDDRAIFIQHSAAPIHDHKKHLLGAVMVFDDVTEARRMARELEWSATHDPLTGLVNRREFENRVQQAVVTAQQDRAEHVLMFMDLDRFKAVNDTCGHAVGDELLKQVTALIHAELRASDLIARLGGDEFGALLPYCTMAAATHIANNILQRVEQFSFIWEGKAFSIGVSIGLAAIAQSTGNYTAVLNAADMACYAAKQSGRHRVHVYQPNSQAV